MGSGARLGDVVVVVVGDCVGGAPTGLVYLSAGGGVGPLFAVTSAILKGADCEYYKSRLTQNCL